MTIDDQKLNRFQSIQVTLQLIGTNWSSIITLLMTNIDNQMKLICFHLRERERDHFPPGYTTILYMTVDRLINIDN